MAAAPEASEPSVIIRADGGESIGGGHIVRAKIIAAALKSAGMEPHLLAKENDWTRESLADAAWPVHYLRKTDNESIIVLQTARRCAARLVILDVRDTSAEYVRYLKESGAAVITIDDPGRGAELADATFRAGVTPRREKNFYYGPAYAILSPRILDLREKARPPSQLRDVVCFFGTFDPKNHGRLISSLAESFPKIGFHWFTKGTMLARPNVQIFAPDQEKFLEKLMSADLAIISGGVTLFEAAAVGRPAIVLPEAPHEMDQGELLASGGAVLLLEHPTGKNLEQVFAELARNPGRLGVFHAKSMEMVDGRGLERFLRVVRSLLV